MSGSKQNQSPKDPQSLVAPTGSSSSRTQPSSITQTLQPDATILYVFLPYCAFDVLGRQKQVTNNVKEENSTTSTNTKDPNHYHFSVHDITFLCPSILPLVNFTTCTSCLNEWFFPPHQRYLIYSLNVWLQPWTSPPFLSQVSGAAQTHRHPRHTQLT